MWNGHGRALVSRSGQEAAAAFVSRYNDQVGGANGSEEELRQPISASEVEEASSMVFQRSTGTPSDYVFSPSAAEPSRQPGGNVYPRLRPNQTLRGEVLAMGHRLAAHPAVQSAIVDDIVRHGRVPAGRRSVRPTLQSPPGDERGLVRLVDMLEPEDDPTRGRGRSTTSQSGQESGGMIFRGRRSIFDYDDESPLRHMQLDPHVSQEWEGAYAAAQDDNWQPWAEEKKEDNAEGDGGGSRISDGKLGCSCRKCHESQDVAVEDEEEASEGNCWKDVLAEYECDICFEVLVGVHVLDNCGHHFCGACMERWMDNAPQGECPVCRTPVDKLVPVRKMDEMIAKAVDAAAPSRERSAWYERSSHWEGTARRRQEAADRARAASVARAEEDAATARPGASRGQDRAEGARPGSGRGRREGGAGGRDGGDRGDDRGEPGFRLTKIQAVLAVAVMLVVAVMKIRGFKR